MRSIFFFFKERWEVFNYSENVTVNQMCPELFSPTLCQQTDIPSKDLFKNITEVLGEEKYPSNTYTCNI